MEKLIFTSVILCVGICAKGAEPTDSIAPTSLGEIVVEANQVIETPKKTIVYPTEAQRGRSTNGYQLLADLNMPDLDVDAQEQVISTIAGRTAVILINGAEALPDELATLSASDIVRIDFQRNPSGKYAGQGVVINFLTEEYAYGGNVYVSADEGLIRQYGTYTGMVNYKRKALSMSLTASASWAHDSALNSSGDSFDFPSGMLYQTITPVEDISRNNSGFVRFKIGQIADNHSFTAALSTILDATPRHSLDSKVAYSGLYDFESELQRSSTESAVSPSLNVCYRLAMPKAQLLSVNFDASLGHTRYKSLYQETGIEPITGHSKEDHVSAMLDMSYRKELPHGITVGATMMEWYKNFHDTYEGGYDGKQTLANNCAHLYADYQQDLSWGLFYYASLGVSSLVSSLGAETDSQVNPVAFYGASYAFGQGHSLSFNGIYMHSVYDPSYKNSAVIPTSFFQATVGNPALKPLKVMQNTLSYNGRFGVFGVTATYDQLRYLDNTSKQYYVDGNTVYNRLVNDGNYSYHKFIVGASLNLIDDRLRFNVKGTYSINRFQSTYRPNRSNNWRFVANAAYSFGCWQIKGVWSPAFSGLGIDGEHFRVSSQYGLIASLKRGPWAAECTVKNFLKRYRGTTTSVDYGCYRHYANDLCESYGRNVCLTLTYTLSYGKKVERDDGEVKTTVNSAILRPF